MKYCHQLPLFCSKSSRLKGWNLRMLRMKQTINCLAEWYTSWYINPVPYTVIGNINSCTYETLQLIPNGYIYPCILILQCECVCLLYTINVSPYAHLNICSGQYFSILCLFLCVLFFLYQVSQMQGIILFFWKFYL